MKNHVCNILCLLTMLGFALMFVQTQWKPVKMKPLNGYTDISDKPTLTLNGFASGDYQNDLEHYIRDNFGFREFFIRYYNQVCYSCFDKITNDNIQKGYDNELFLNMYLNEVTGKQLHQVYGSVENAQLDARKNVEETLALIDTLRQRGTTFMFVFAPSKTAVYPEKTPKNCQDQALGFSLEEYYIELFKEKGIPHIDFLNHFRAMKDTVAYPLYTRTGTHWAESTIPMVADSIYRKLESLTGLHLPSINCIDQNITTDYTPLDRELESSMNLLFPLKKPALPRPVFTLKDTIDADRPNLLVVGDSYFNQLQHSPFVKAFGQWDYWLYNRESYSSRSFYHGKQLDVIFDAADILKDADIVMAIFTAPMFYNYMFGFTHTALELLHHGTMSDAEALQTIIKKIMNDPAWMKAIEEQAERLGVSLEENLRTNAEYVLQNLKQTDQQP